MSAKAAVPQGALVEAKTPLIPQQDGETFPHLLRKFEPLIAGLSLRLGANYDDRQDLAQEGRLGLLQAAERYDPRRQTSFSAYAVPYIRGRMLRWFRRERQGRVLTRADQGSSGGVVDQRSRIVDQGVSDPEMLQDQNPDSDPERNTYLTEITPRIAEARRMLSERRAQTVQLRFWDDLRPSEIAEVLGVSRPRVTQLLSTALKRLHPLLREVACT